MQLSDIPRDPSPRTLRQFAGLCVVFAGGWAAWRWWHGDQRTAELLAGVALLAGAFGIVAPALLRPVFVGWMMLVFPIGWVVSRVTLVALFLLVMTPVAWWFRLTGRDVLWLKRPNRASYWVPKPQPPGIDSYFRQS